MPRRFALAVAILASLIYLTAPPAANAHEGPDPISHWFFSKSTVADGKVEARLGPDAKIIGAPKLVTDKLGAALRFDGVHDYLEIADEGAPKPDRYFTLSAWVVIEAPNPQGAIIGQFEKDGDGEKGFLLGYNDHVFRFAISASGSDDGNGKATILEGKTKYELGKYYHVVATYDGAEMRLYV